MAKQRRKSTPPVKSKSSKTTTKPVASGRKTAPKAKAARRLPKPAATTRLAASSRRPKAATAKQPAKKSGTAVVKTQAKAPARPARPAATTPVPERRSNYAEAVALYQRGTEALQARRYRDASDLLNSVISRYPDEKELHERAFLYLRVCERQIAANPAKSETPEERLFAATLAINNGSPDQAIAMLGPIVADDPENDQATYILGVASALKGRPDVAVQFLSRAMALNPENRDVARKDPDLEPLRRTEEMRSLLASPPLPLPRRDKRHSPKGKGR